jgi:hypothetical protein
MLVGMIGYFIDAAQLLRFPADSTGFIADFADSSPLFAESAKTSAKIWGK